MSATKQIQFNAWVIYRAIKAHKLDKARFALHGLERGLYQYFTEHSNLA